MAKLVREKWPFFGLTALFCFITWYSVKLGNYIVSSDTLPLARRLSNIPIAYVRYLWKTVWPSELAVVYPMPDHWPGELVIGATLILLVITWLVLRARSAPYLAVGWFSFVGMLVPTIGFVPVGQQAMAERYMYVPAVGLFAAAVWWVADLSTRWKHRQLILSFLTVAVLSICCFLTVNQVRYWRDSVSLWGHCVESNPGYSFARVVYGRAYASVGDTNKAVEQYQIALRMNPDEPLGNLSYGGTLLQMGNVEEATNYLARALQLDPSLVEAYENLGLALVELHEYKGAVSYFAEEIKMNPLRPAAYMEMGRALSASGKSDEAVDYFKKALRLSPAYSVTHYYLGMEYLSRGSLVEAASSLKSALKCDPTLLGAHLNLAQVYSRQHETANAISEYRAALRLNSDLPEALNNLAWMLATTPEAGYRDGVEAVKLARNACDKTSWKQTMLIGTLAAAYAEAGDFDKAVQTAQKACDTASAQGEKELLKRNQELLAQYKNRQPYREGN